MILAGTRGGKYLTMFLGVIDIPGKSISYVNCGHVIPVVVRTEGEPIELTEGGMVVGLFDNLRYEEGAVKFQAGDVLILCTDGITESMDREQEEYGTQRLVQRVQASISQSAAEVVSAVAADVSVYSREGTHLDDKVLIAIKVE